MLLEDDAFADSLETWCEQRCKVFDDDQEEHALVHTDLHEVIKALKKGF